MIEQLGIIGCGLMGGSFALALRRSGQVRRVVGYSKSPASAERARELGVIDAVAQSALGAVAGSDVVLLAVPVAATEFTFRSIAALLSPGVLVMDVGSTKRDVVDAARRTLGERIAFFVPAHPIAGKETAGVDAADASLYAGRRVILTPQPENDPALVQRATDAWAAVGSQVFTMTAQNHDAAFAAVSHLPHLLAYAYMNALGAQPQGADFLSLAGPGFRDFTRIAASDPTIWRDILLANRDEVLRQLGAFRGALQGLEAAITQGDGRAIEDAVRRASALRQDWQDQPLR